MRIGIISLGCAKNRVNSEQMMYLLNEAGYQVTEDTDNVDAVVVNTCCFVESAKSEAIDTILELAESKASGTISKLIVTGCLPQRYKDSILQEMPEIDAIAGTGSFDDIVGIVNRTLNQKNNKASIERMTAFGDISAPISETKRIISTSYKWAYLKIAEGCDNRCAYCCIPSIRGKYRSRPIENIVNEAKELTDLGYMELVLVAQDVTAYGIDLYGERQLTHLLRALTGIEKLKWIRLMYMYPNKIDDVLIDEISKSDKILKYLDIPIQHINDKILRSMNRQGTGSEIKELLAKLRARIPSIVLRTSLITGLPGEGDEEFDQLCELLREAGIERVGVFTYSQEEGTPAALMKCPDKGTAERRAEIIQDIQSNIMQRFNSRRIGSIEQVLIDDSIINKKPYAKEHRLHARSYAEAPEVDGYISIKVKPSDKPLVPPNSLVNVKITGIENGELIGKIAEL